MRSFATVDMKAFACIFHYAFVRMQTGVARTQWNAPEIDSSVMVDKALSVGQFAEITVYDLVAAR